MDTLTDLETQKIFPENLYDILDEGHQRAKKLPDHMVQVIPGEKYFDTIQAAIESIHDASQRLVYQVLVGPGTYNERVKTIEYIHVIGAGVDETRINQHGFEGSYVGAIQAVSNCTLSYFTLNATGPRPEDEGRPDGDFYCIGVLLQTAGTFHLRGVNIHSTDHGNKGVNVRAISNRADIATGFAIINNCNISAMATGVDSTSVAVEVLRGGSNYDIDVCVIEAGSNGSGITTAEGAQVIVGASTITGQIYALYDTDEVSTITANQCVINGPVSRGVIVNP